MYPFNFPGAREIKKPDNMTDEQCMSMPARVQLLEDGRRFWIIAYMPSYEDRVAINAGRNIYLRVSTIFAAAGYTLGGDNKGYSMPLDDNCFMQLQFKPTEQTMTDVNNGKPVYFTLISEFLPVNSCFTLNDKDQINE